MSQKYNCIAFAVNDTEKWWRPAPPEVQEVYWPEGVIREETIAAFRDAFAMRNFLDCDREELEPGFEKIALFANNQGVPRHAARQLSSGRWTSKLGEREDIEHALRDLEGIVYGTVVFVMKRPLHSES